MAGGGLTFAASFATGVLAEAPRFIEARREEDAASLDDGAAEG